MITLAPGTIALIRHLRRARLTGLDRLVEHAIDWTPLLVSAEKNTCADQERKQQECAKNGTDDDTSDLTSCKTSAMVDSSWGARSRG